MSHRRRPVQLPEQTIGRRSREIYTDANHAASFTSPSRVLEALKKEGNGLERATLEQVKQGLASLPSYSRHRQIRRRSHHMTTRSDDVDERWQVDLMNTSSFQSQLNGGYKYLLVIIDVFSRRLMIVPLNDRKCEEVTEALELIFMTTGRIPKTITSDSGQEFKGKAFKALCSKYSVRQFFTVSDKTHASLVERVIRTMRTRVGKLMTHRGSTRYFDQLGNLVDNYNDSKHSTLGMTPNEASSSLANRQLALFNVRWRLNRPNMPKREEKISFREGDQMRIPMPFRRFQKSHEPTFSEQTFPVRITFRNDKKRPVARLIHNKGKSVYYPFELSST